MISLSLISLRVLWGTLLSQYLGLASEKKRVSFETRHEVARKTVENCSFVFLFDHLRVVSTLIECYTEKTLNVGNNVY